MRAAVFGFATDLLPYLGHRVHLDLRRGLNRAAPSPEDDGMPAYLVAFRRLMGSHDLALWIARYLKDEVAGIQAANTLEGKVSGFRAFVQWMVQATGQATLAEWLPRDTQSYVRYLMGQRRVPATVNRHLATPRRFAR